ncbi:hypothetical protein BH23GEM9_BH23GEM9_04320 [soil metagenome]
MTVGVMAGLLTSMLILYIFFTGIGGDEGMSPTLVGEDAVVDPEVRETRRLPEGPGRGVMGRRERGIESRLAGMPVSARPLRGPLSITMRNVIWNEADGTRFARADFISAQLDAAAVQRGDAILTNMVVRRPVVALRQDTPLGGWNYEQVFAELLEPQPEPRGPVRTIQLRNLQVVDGTVNVRMPDRRFDFESAQARMPLVVLSQPGVPEPYIRLALLTTEYVQRTPIEGRLAIEARDGLLHFPEGRVRFDVADVRLDRTQLAAVRGVWNPADPGYGVTAEGLAVGVELEDFEFLTPESFPATGTASFAFSVRPFAGDLTEATLTDLDARTGESRFVGSLTARFGEEYFLLRAADLQLDPLQLAVVEGFTGPLPYSGALRGRVHGTDGDISFDLTASLQAATVAAPFTVDLAGRALLLEDAVALRRVDITFDRLPLAAMLAVAPGLPLDGFVTGRVSLEGPPNVAPLALDVRLELGMGVALVDGTLDLTGPVPAYDVTGRLVGVDLRALLAPDVPPVAFTGAFALRGVGAEPASMDASLRIGGRFTGWQAAQGDTLQLVAALQQGTLQVQELVARLATADITASGAWRFLEPQSGAVTYTMAVSSLRPFGPYLPVVGDSVAAGAVTAAGTLSGTLNRMRLAGRLEATDVRAGGWQAVALASDYDIAVGGDLLPEAVVDARARGVVTPTLGSFETAALTLRMTAPDLAFELNAVRADGGVVQIAATGLVPEDGPRTILVQSARFDLEEGQWSLTQPAIVRLVGDEVFVDGLVLEEPATGGRIYVDGRVLPLVDVDAQIQLAALPTGDIQRLLGQAVRVEGMLWADGVIRGDATAPVVAVDFRIEQAVIERVPMQRLEGRLAYQNQLTQITATALADTAGFLALELTLPSVLQLGGEPVFSLLDGVPLSGSLTARQFALAPFVSAAPLTVRDAAGVINAQVELTGSAEAPQVSGAATLTGGAVTVVDLNQRYDQISADIGFDGRRLVIRDLRARSDGWVVLGGQVVLERLDEPVLDLNIVFDGFRPMGVENQRDAALFGTLAVTGPPASLELTGAITVDDGYLVIPQFGGAGAELVDITRPAPVMGRTLEVIEDGGPMENLRIRDLRVTVGEATWFLADEARAQLSGVLTINKIGTETPITGTLSGTRGQYTLIAGPIVRRFDVVSAQVRFLGSTPPNPSIDITARRIVFDPAGRQVDVDVRITGTLETPRLSLAGGDAVGVADSELLSFLLFGQPTFALGGQFLLGEDILEQTFWGGLAEVMAIELERGLGGFGLDVFQIRLGAGPMGGLGAPTVVLGRQLRPDVFLTVETGVAALLGGGGNEGTPLHWAVRLDWTFDPRSRARLAWEPVYSGRAFRGAALALPLTDPRQQFLLEVRRRWAY